MLEAFFSSPPNFSTAATFLARVTAIFKPFQKSSRLSPYTSCLPERSQARSEATGLAESKDLYLTSELRLSRDLNRSRVQQDPRPHARTQITALDVLPLRDRWLSLDHAGNQSS